jgi:hypothetical protein
MKIEEREMEIRARQKCIFCMFIKFQEMKHAKARDITHIIVLQCSSSNLLTHRSSARIKSSLLTRSTIQSKQTEEATTKKNNHGNGPTTTTIASSSL